MPSGEKMTTNKQITSTVTDQGKLEIAITESERPIPKDNEVLIEIQATPINPSDLGLLLGLVISILSKLKTQKLLWMFQKRLWGL